MDELRPYVNPDEDPDWQEGSAPTATDVPGLVAELETYIHQARRDGLGENLSDIASTARNLADAADRALDERDGERSAGA